MRMEPPTTSVYTARVPLVGCRKSLGRNGALGPLCEHALVLHFEGGLLSFAQRTFSGRLSQAATLSNGLSRLVLTGITIALNSAARPDRGPAWTRPRHEADRLF